jgi:hypothetical protein
MSDKIRKWIPGYYTSMDNTARDLFKRQRSGDLLDRYDACKKAFNDWKLGKLEDKDFKEVLNMFFE